MVLLERHCSRNVLSLECKSILVNSRRTFVGLVRSHRTRVGRIRAVVGSGREGKGEGREQYEQR